MGEADNRLESDSIAKNRVRAWGRKNFRRSADKTENKLLHEPI